MPSLSISATAAPVPSPLTSELIAKSISFSSPFSFILNNIGEPNKIFKIRENGELKEIDLAINSEPNGLGTGAAVADIDKDGILELLISHGETGNQILSLYKADIKKSNNFLRIKPLNKNGAPARGATVTLTSNLREHSKTIDAGSGYLCQMEPVAHYGIRDTEKDFKVSIKWANGKINNYKIPKIGKTYIFQESKMTVNSNASLIIK